MPPSAGLVWIWTIFTLPTILVLVGNHPDVQVDNPLLQICDNFDMLRQVLWGYGWCRHSRVRFCWQLIPGVVYQARDLRYTWQMRRVLSYPSLVAAASSGTKAVQTCWISATVRRLKNSSTSTWSHAWWQLCCRIHCSFPTTERVAMIWFGFIPMIIIDILYNIYIYNDRYTYYKFRPSVC